MCCFEVHIGQKRDTWDRECVKLGQISCFGEILSNTGQGHKIGTDHPKYFTSYEDVDSDFAD